MANIRIADTPQRIQYVATASQTIFSVPFPFLVNTDIVVYQNSTKLAQGGAPGQYGLSGAGTASGGTMTLVTGATVNDIITIYGDTPVDRTSIYSPTVSNLTGDDLNNDFNRDIIMIKQQQTTQDFLQLQYAPYASVSQDMTVTTDRWLPILPAGGMWRKNDANTAIEAAVVPAFPVGSFGGNFTQSYRLVRTNISGGANEIEQMDVALTSGPLNMSSTAASWTIGSASDLNLTASQYLNLKGQRWPNAIGSEGQVVGVSGGILAYLNVPTANVPTIVDQIPMFIDTFGGLDDSPFARSGNNLLLPADPTVALAAATKQYVDAHVPVGAALTKTDDTNVTLTLGGSPTDALLNAASLTLGWTGTLAETRGGTAQSTYALGDTLYASAANTLSKLAGNTTIVKQYLSQTGTGAVSAAPAWATISGGDITGAALSKTDDTNVTMSLGGTPTTALLRAASMTLGWTGQLAPGRGGTGVDNSTSTITIGGNVTFSGAHTFTGTITADTSVTFPTSGTLLTSAGAVTSLAGTANQIAASASTGAVTLSLVSDAILPGTGGVQLPGGTTAQRAGAAGTIRFNSQAGVFESTADGATWATIETSATGVISVSGTLNRVTVSPTTGLCVVDIDAAYVGQSSITTLGTIGTGTWQGTAVAGTYGGTGVNNGASTITIGGNVTFSGAHTFTGTLSADTSVTFPTSGTLVNTGVTTLSSLTTVGALASGSLAAGFTAVTVPIGGTGLSSATAYMPICGGTTTTGAFQSVSTAGASAGYVLTYVSTSALPTWQSAAGSSTLVPLATLSASNSSSLEFLSLFSASYYQYLFVFNSIFPATNAVNFYCQIGDAGGYKNSAYVWCVMGNGAATATNTGSTGDSQMVLSINSTYTMSNTHANYSGQMMVSGPNAASTLAQFTGYASYNYNSGSYLPATIQFGGNQAPAATFTKMNFYMSSGNITSGTIDVFGIKAG